MRRLCLAVGISDAPPLDFLPGAVNGARDMAAWAKAAGYDEVRLLTDEEVPIGIDMIAEALVGRPAEPGRAAVPGLLRPGVPTERLLLYFAGHGLARDAEEDLWLVSQWYREERAIAVGGLRRKLERFGIEQIVIVADACRSSGTDQKSADLTADKVLGAGPFDPNLPRADIFKASSRFRAAFMIPGETIDDDRCIFSGVLLEALWGHHDEAFSKHRATRCITGDSLADFLEIAVPARAGTYGVTLRPDIVTGLREGQDVYLGAAIADAPPLAAWPAPSGATSAMGVDLPSRAGGARGWSTKTAAAPETAARAIDGGVFGLDLAAGLPLDFAAATAGAEPPPPDLAAIAAEDAAASTERRAARTARAEAFERSYGNERERPTHFETGAGFSVEGARVMTVRLGPTAIGEDERDRHWWRIAPRPERAGDDPWFGGRLGHPIPLLAELDDGRWIGAAALPDFVASFTVGAAGAESLVYRAMGNAGGAAVTEAAVAALRAGTLKADAGLDYVVALRGEKFVDPILGVIAAYLYDARADTDSIRQIAFFHAERRQPVPYDVAMLARLPIARDAAGRPIATIPAVEQRTPRTALEERLSWTTMATPEARAPVAGAFPWMRQGWSQLDDDDPIVLPGVAELATHLGAAPFTTLDAGAGQRLAQIIFEGET